MSRSRSESSTPQEVGPTGGLCAFVDESMQQATQERSGTYLLVAAVTAEERCEEIRQSVRSVLYKKEQRLHWYDATPIHRTKVASTVGTLGMSATVVIGTPLTNKGQERARRKCMETLLPHLEAMGVGRVVLEARTPSLIEADERHVRTMRGKHLITRALWTETARAVDEPLLWVPDAIAGAYGAARAHGRTDWLDLVGYVEEIEISTR